MAVDPGTRAKFRLALFRIESDWYQLAEQYEADGERKLSTKSRKMLRDSILASVELFNVKKYFLSDDFSFSACGCAPMLGR